MDTQNAGTQKNFRLGGKEVGALAKDSLGRETKICQQ